LSARGGLVQNLSEPLFGKEGYGEILWRYRLIQKIPLNPPLTKGEDARKDSLRVVDPTSL
jgi:hypothetical protein